jgi:hypothetical protein
VSKAGAKNALPPNFNQEIHIKNMLKIMKKENIYWTQLLYLMGQAAQMPEGLTKKLEEFQMDPFTTFESFLNTLGLEYLGRFEHTLGLVRKQRSGHRSNLGSRMMHAASYIRPQLGPVYYTRNTPNLLAGGTGVRNTHKPLTSRSKAALSRRQ